MLQAFFHIIINNSYGPLIHALPLSLADKTHTMSMLDDGARDSLDTADSIRRAKAKGSASAARAPSAEQQVVTQEQAFSSDPESQHSPTLGDTASEAGSTSDPVPIKAVDEDAGPKEFYHPASVEPQRVVWLPQDVLGLADEEAKHLREAGILVSLEDAAMDDKGHVDISGAPPGGVVRTL